ncbi:MAG: O-antigen ligase family protein [Marinilabiliales bacterium]|nr:MAG: O-antigen ligase family protein [Marinilabiliales bacterium]
MASPAAPGCCCCNCICDHNGLCQDSQNGLINRVQMPGNAINRYGILSVTSIVALVIAIIIAGSLLYPVLAIMTGAILIFVLAHLVVRFNLQAVLLKLMAFVLPFSVTVPLTEGSMIRVPGEPLVLVAAAVLFMEIAGGSFKRMNDVLHREFLWLLPFAAAFLVTIPFSQILVVSVKFSFINLLYMLVFYIFVARQLRYDSNLFFQMILLYSMGMLVVLLWSLFRFWQWEWNPVVMRGIFLPFYNDHTIFGASAAILAALWLSTVTLCRNNKTRIFWLVTGLFFIMTVIFTTSRAALLSLPLFLLVLTLLYLKLKVRHLLIIGGVFLLGVVVFRQPLVNRMQQVEALSYDVNAGIGERTVSSANISTDVSNIERLNRWVSAWRMFKERPLTGFGPGTYQFTYIPYQEPSLMNRLTVTDPWNVPEGSGGTAHSEYLLALSEMGIMGLAGWLLFIGRLMFLAFDRSTGHRSRVIIIAAFAALATWFFHAFFNNFLNTDKFAFLFWGTAAWLVTNYHTKDEEHLLRQN